MSRFSIKWLLLAVAYVAISIAALLNANDYWRHGFESAAFLLILTAILGTIFSAGKRRAFWAGWLVFGAAWSLFAMGLFEFSNAWPNRLITTTGLNALHGLVIVPTYEHFPRTATQAALNRSRSLGARITRLPDGRYQITYFRPSRSEFTAVGNRILYIPFALLGSAVATWFWHKREQER